MDYLVNKRIYSILLLLFVIFIALATDQLVKSHNFDVVNKLENMDLNKS